ncbi:MAG: hypothetical protein H0W88_04055 [Parachlamydiaceae bacterium]|nr:hypothetical protein [Parachlamydiaceae bacterium]
MTVISDTPSPSQIPSDKTTDKTTPKDESTEKISKVAKEGISPPLVETIRQEIELEEKRNELTSKLEKLNAEILTLKKPDNSTYADVLSQKNKEVDNTRLALLDINKTLADSKIDYSKKENQFIKQALKILKAHPQRILSESQKNHLFTQAFHVGLKGSIIEDILPLHPYYQGVYSPQYAQLRAKYALTLLKLVIESDKPVEGFTTPKDQEQLLVICKQRNLFCDYQDLFADIHSNPDEKNPAIKKITDKFIDNINELDNPDSSNVITLENGDRSFIFPGGWHKHYISYEIKKTKSGDYEFIIHNRGEKSDDTRFHSSFTQKIGDKTYARTRVPIRISKESLQNRDFVTFLVQAKKNSSSSGTLVYDKLYKHLIEDGKGQIILSEEEKLINILRGIINPYSLNKDDKTKIDVFIEDLIHADPNFHSLQLFGTCGESNLTTTEKDRADNSIHRTLKFYTLAGFVEEIKRKYLNKKDPLKTKDTSEAIIELEKQLPKDSPILEKTKKIKEFIEAYNMFLESEKDFRAIAGDPDKLLVRKTAYETDKAKAIARRDAVLKECEPQITAMKKVIDSISDNAKRDEAKEYFDLIGTTDQGFDFLDFKDEFFNIQTGYHLFISDKSSYGDPMQILEEKCKVIDELDKEIDMHDKNIQNLTPETYFPFTAKHKRYLVEATLKQLYEIDMATNTPLISLINEIHEHLIKEFEIDKRFEVHIGGKISSLRKKIEKPPSKIPKFNKDDIWTFINKIITAEIVLDKSKPKTAKLGEFLRELYHYKYQISSRFSSIKNIENKPIKLAALQVLKNDYSKDLDTYQRNLLIYQKEAFDLSMNEYNLSLEKYKTQIEKDADKDDKIKAFEKQHLPPKDPLISIRMRSFRVAMEEFIKLDLNITKEMDELSKALAQPKSELWSPTDLYT